MGALAEAKSERPRKVSDGGKRALDQAMAQVPRRLPCCQTTVVLKSQPRGDAVLRPVNMCVTPPAQD